ncbi:DNA-binding response regulator [Paenibacillus sambharensis]|uniref:DNA-binding response regulator n=1 Tax=Paenibacillus sambharensis TaxID=1803190 RepID=A0A2W1LMK9_9BACL|nr:response regulator [Paenibacillus sambharensis]PZD93031.1 DNA-binding response regulator [Paenibacillus sambharensis]
MHQLLIVDDQPDLVDDLADMIPWEQAGIIKVHKAYSAQEALEIVAVNPVGVIITDIRMPGASGLDLIEQVRATWDKIRCILLSGYEDFDYAKRALQNRVTDYLLKPCEDEELIGAVQRAVKDIEAEWEAISSYQNAMQSIRQNRPALRNHLLMDLLEGSRVPEDELAERLELLEVPVQSGRPYCLMLLRLEDYFDRYRGSDVPLMEYAVFNMAEELFADTFHLWQVKDKHGYMVFLIQPKSEPGTGEAGLKDTAENKASRLQHSVKQFLKGTVSVLISRWHPFPQELSPLYDESVVQFRQHIGSDRELLLTIADSPEQRAQSVNSLTHLYDPPMLVHLLEAGQWNALDEKMDAIFDELEQKWSHSHEHILETYFMIVSAFSYSIHKSKRLMSELMGEEYRKLVSGPQFHTIQQLRDWSAGILETYKRTMAEEAKDSRSSLVRQVQDYVHHHLGEASLQSIAGHVFLNPSYLSKVYKLETGEGISDYLFRLKMEQATYKLRNTNEKIYEIAEGLGYLKTSYFIKLFKDKYGMTPQEYRDRLA